MKNLLFLLFCLINFSVNAQNNAQYVHVFIGTDGTGHTFPGASLPFGMVQPSPDNKNQDWAYTSGYQYKDTTILGFSQTHFSGTGIGEMGDILLLPFDESRKAQRNGYVKKSEKGTVGYYAVTKKDCVKVELTCSERVAFHRYAFPTEQARLYANFQHGLRFLTDSLVLESDIRIENNQTISGYCHTKNWVERKYFFVLQVDKPFTQKEELPKGKKDKAPQYNFSFNVGKSKTLQIKIALSTVSMEGAKNNLQTEIPHWNFQKVKKNAEKVWNSYLDKIDIEISDSWKPNRSTPTQEKQKFYTALYHLLLQPSNIADVDGKYRGADDKIAQAPNKEYYSTLSIWDIYRGAFPLLQIIVPERIDGIVNTMLLHHKANKFLPIWTAWGQDNYCMIGNHAIPMILSAYQNGFRGFDAKEALQAMVETSTRSHINSDWELYNQYGYYPFDKLDNEAVSRTLESGYDDWCVGKMAELLGENNTAQTFYKRANYYKNLFDTETKLFRGKDTKGNWRTPFEPLKATSPMNNPGDYTEANAWQYFWTPAQYDVQGIMELLGGKEGFTKQLNDFFTIQALNPDKYLGQEAMIGQYAHGNEPSHHIAYLYAYSNEPEKGQTIINQIVKDFHKATPDGMIGNDDCGQMSAWYILACLGFYPTNPATNEFVLGMPQLKSATITLPAGKKLAIQTTGGYAGFRKKTTLKDKIIEKPFLTYQEIMQGGKLIFELGK
jgi:predicted alpha-1,2-mannosidase